MSSSAVGGSRACLCLCERASHLPQDGRLPQRPVEAALLMLQGACQRETGLHRMLWFETVVTQGSISPDPRPTCPTPTLPVSDFEVLIRCFSPLVFSCIPGWVGRVQPPFLEGRPHTVLRHAGSALLTPSRLRSKIPSASPRWAGSSSVHLRSCPAYLEFPLYCWPLGFAFLSSQPINMYFKICSIYYI